MDQPGVESGESYQQGYPSQQLMSNSQRAESPRAYFHDPNPTQSPNVQAVMNESRDQIYNHQISISSINPPQFHATREQLINE
jgi:hypothetical protein